METLTQPITFTDVAIAEIKRLLQNEPTNKKLRVGAKGGGCSGLSYVLEFDMPQEDDLVFTTDDFNFIMNKSHQLYLYGMTIDWQDGLNSRGFVFKNPNATKTCGCGTSFSV